MIMKRIIVVALVNFSLLWGQAVPTDQIIYPTAEVLAANHLNAQGGYVNLVGREGWRPALRFGIGGHVEFEWTRLGFYSDLVGTRQTIPTAGVKLRLPTPFKSFHMAASLYNAQQWDYHPSSVYADGVRNLSYDENYGSLKDRYGVILNQVDFESIYSRFDVLASWEVVEGFRLHSAVYMLEAKSRNLNVVWTEKDSVFQYDSYSDSKQRKNQLVGFGLGLNYAIDSHLTYLVQWVIQPQYHFDFGAKRLTLEPRHVWIVGARYRIFNVLLVDFGVFNDEFEGTLSDVQVYSMLNLLWDVTQIKGWFEHK